MRLVVIDLIPALLSWEGRDLSRDPQVAPDAAAALGDLFVRFRMAGVVDAASETSGSQLRDHLGRNELLDYFDMVGTTAEFGPTMSPRVMRRIVRVLGGPDDRTLLVTARPELIQSFSRSRIPLVMTTMAEFGTVVEVIEGLLGGGRINP